MRAQDAEPRKPPKLLPLQEAQAANPSVQEIDVCSEFGVAFGCSQSTHPKYPEPDPCRYAAWWIGLSQSTVDPAWA